MYNKKYELWSNILIGLNEGKSLHRSYGTEIPGGFYKKYFDDLISMGYVDGNTRKPTETGLLFLHAHDQLKRLGMGKKVKESLILNETVENLSRGLIEKTEGYKVYIDFYAEILLKAKSECRKISLIAITNSDVLKRYLPRLIKARLLETNDKSGKTIYQTTKLGLEYIKWYYYFTLFAKGGTNEDKWEITHQTSET